MDGVAAAIACVFLGRRFGSRGSKTYGPSARNSDPRIYVSARRGYLPTQVVCDFLASKKDLDGIIYKSVQSGYSAKNVVLFHDASRVEDITVPDGAKVSCSVSQQSDDENDVVYSVTVELPAEGSTPEPAPNHLDFSEQYTQYLREMRKAAETRQISLRLDLDSLEVHEVGAVSFKTTDFKVTRHVFTGTMLQPGGSPPPDVEIDYSNLL